MPGARTACGAAPHGLMAPTRPSKRRRAVTWRPAHNHQPRAPGMTRLALPRIDPPRRTIHLLHEAIRTRERYAQAKCGPTGIIAVVDGFHTRLLADQRGRHCCPAPTGRSMRVKLQRVDLVPHGPLVGIVAVAREDDVAAGCDGADDEQPTPALGVVRRRAPWPSLVGDFDTDRRSGASQADLECPAWP